MAGIKSGNNVDKWRNYFRTCNSDIFDIIENAIKVASLDSPQEFKSKRDRIAEILFTSDLPKCVCGDHAELCVVTEEKRVEEVRSEFVSGANKDGKVVDSGRDAPKGEANVNKVESRISYKDAETLSAEIEKESQIFDAVVQIKKILENSKNEAGSLVLDSLRRLESMPLTLEILKATEIGKPVYALKKHASTDIRSIAGMLVELWKHMVNDWVCAAAALKGGLQGATPNSVNPSVVDEEAGLPSPPLEDLSFLVAYDESMEICNLLDGLEDDLSKQRQQLPVESVTDPQPFQPSILISVSERSAEPGSENKARLDTKFLKKPELSSQRPPVLRHNETRYSDHAAQQKLEVTKRKLPEHYQQAENAKRK